jgi:hypothetical protein
MLVLEEAVTLCVLSTATKQLAGELAPAESASVETHLDNVNFCRNIAVVCNIHFCKLLKKEPSLAKGRVGTTTKSVEKYFDVSGESLNLVWH